MKTKSFALKVKDLSEDGTFEGYGSVFGNADSYGEIVEPGAFAESLARHRREGTKPLMLWQHDPDKPIGVWDDLAEDGKGLRGKGRLLAGVSKADEALILLKAGALQGLSIGYREQEVAPDGNNRRLKKLDLLEISLVSFPANRRARVEAVKSEHVTTLRDRLLAGDRPSLREMEKGMRDAFDLSHSEAERAVRLFFKDFAQGDPETVTDLAAIKAALPDLRAALDGILSK
jgi:phage prohead protease, HK97 family